MRDVANHNTTNISQKIATSCLEEVINLSIAINFIVPIFIFTISLPNMLLF